MFHKIKDWLDHNSSMKTGLKYAGALAGIFLAYELFDATNALNWLGKTGLYGTILIRILVVCLGIAIIFFFIKSFKDNFSKASLLSKLGYIGGVISVFLGLIVLPVYLLNTVELVDLPRPPRTEKLYITNLRTYVTHSGRGSSTHTKIDFRNAQGTRDMSVEIPKEAYWQPPTCQAAIASWRKYGATNKIPVTVTYYPHARIIAQLTF
jgi:hypothetical protein